MFARDIMTSPVWYVDPTEMVAHARKMMVKHHISRLLVMKDGSLIGILTKKDLVFGFRDQEPAWRRRPVDRIPVETFASRDPLVIAPDAGIRKIAKIFMDRNISCLPVVENSEVIGIVTKTDLLKSAVAGNLKPKVSEVMEKAVILSRYHSLDHVIDTMGDKNDKLVVENNDGTLAGVITETNLAFFEPFSRRPGSEKKAVIFLRKEDAGGIKLDRYVFTASVIAEDVMSHPAITIGPGAPLSDAVAKMKEHHVNSLVVVENNNVQGILKRDNILQEVAK
jgi:CBS domain-containing protein